MGVMGAAASMAQAFVSVVPQTVFSCRSSYGVAKGPIGDLHIDFSNKYLYAVFKQNCYLLIVICFFMDSNPSDSFTGDYQKDDFIGNSQ